MADDLDIRVESLETTGERLLGVEGELTLVTAAKLQTLLLEGLQPGAKTVLDGGRISVVDLCGLQLICSAHRSYMLKGASFELRNISLALQETARIAGYQACTSVCPFRRDGNCVWNACTTVSP